MSTHDQIGYGRRTSNSRGNERQPTQSDANELNAGEEEEDADDARPTDAELDRHLQILGVWERGRSRSRGTASEQLEVRIRDWELAHQPERLLEWIIDRLLRRVLQGRPPPKLIGFALQPPGWERPFHVPLRPPSQNTAAAIAAALERLLEDYDGLQLCDGRCRTKVCAVWPLPDPTPASTGECLFAYLCVRLLPGAVHGADVA